MSKNLLTILILTLLTIVSWSAFQIFRIKISSTITPPTAEQIRDLNPNIDSGFLENLRESSELN
ncbi:MAG: hypothetical protein A2172_01110 [Candidatus Woykebacteria bacterium RBG_13_40_15]|uniref:Uncharacterized protein n=1 Tax=Candidatus Woykebacteria bacterium RBG_13_40_15 TaxID=1802593 RepID=A0A1G1W8W9_9BACT|nr:MAG: hypothetical protein A2172_01110 [Candidatus Woykebacteria bacterium RBG_13_40_15]